MKIFFRAVFLQAKVHNNVPTPTFQHIVIISLTTFFLLFLPDFQFLYLFQDNFFLLIIN